MPDSRATRNRRGFFALVLVAVLGSVACAGAQHGGERPLRVLPEARALDVVLDAFHTQGVEVQRGRVVTLRNGSSLTLDVAVAGRDYGVEYFHDQDRSDVGPSALPQRTRDDALLTTACRAPDGSAVEVLILHDHEFLYEPDPDRTGEGRPSLFEVEDRLRRAVVDYLAHLRVQGHLR